MLVDKALSYFMIKQRHRYHAVPTNVIDAEFTSYQNEANNMETCRKFRLILWKNWLFRKRQYIVTFFEIILPTLFSALLLYLRNQGGDQFSGHNVYNFTEYHTENVLSNVDLHSAKVLLYAPNTTVTLELLRYVMNNSYINPPFKLRGVANDEEMDNLALKDTNNTLAGISFIGLENSLPEKLHYRIRLSPSGNQWMTQILAPTSPPPGPIKFFPPYNTAGFLTIQHLVALRFIEMSTDRKNLLENTNISLQQYPYPPYFDDAGYSNLLQQMLPLFIALSYVFISPTLIKHIVREKELGVKELMKLMGLPGWLQWCGWFVSSFTIMTISAIIIVKLLSCDWFGIRTVLTHTAPELFLTVLVLYVMSAICFCFVITTFFSKPTLATACGVVIWLMTFSIPFYNLNPKYATLSVFVKLLVMLLPNMAMAWAVRFMVAFEGRNLGLGWGNLLDPSFPGDNMTMAHVIFMLFFDIIFYSFLAWYLDNVLPSAFGIRKPWYFLFTSTYWCHGAIKHEVDSEDLSRKNSIDFEPDPVGLKANVEIMRLSKRYGWREKGKLAVSNLNLNVYEGQITALLGHNGAGKTTTMSMLTGMFPPTSGTAFINQCDIRTEIDEARKELGLCPQHNMLFNNLTVEEHLQFFGSLKVKSSKVLNNEITMLLEKLQLTDKRNTFIMKLSGGMKRKVNLGIALIGGPKVVMLDEPTSGMDPEARRAIWDLLQEFRVGRTIVLTTHFMEEADVLADRIAIMASGEIVCCGTPIFLKNRYGAGYHLNISKGENCKVEKISEMIEKDIKGSYMSSNNNMEVSFVLPTDQSSNFPFAFKHLEDNMNDLGATNFGISITTMEEVFLKVGEDSEKQSDFIASSENGSRSNFAAVSRRSALTEKNTGCALWAEQLFAMLLKRWFYARRRWILLIAQVLLPILMVFTVLKLNNDIATISASEPALLIDISQYGSTTAFINEDSAIKPWYRMSFPANTEIVLEPNPTKYLEDLSVNDYPSYLKNNIVGAVFKNIRDDFDAIAWFNGMYYHTQPLTLNLLHNAMVKYYANNASISLTVENAPLPSSEERENSMSNMLANIQAVMIGIFVPIGFSFLSSSFVVFPIHERATRCKHLQLMTGVGGTMFWGASFLWDFITHIICSCIVLVVFITVDTTGAFTGGDRTGNLFLLLFLLGWSSIPFTYLASFLTSLPATGFSRLTTINLIAGIILSNTVYFLKLTSTGDWIYVLQWCCRLLPNFTITIALMNMVQISTLKKACEKMVFCPPLPSYLQWDAPGNGQEIMTLCITGSLYCLILAVVERGILYRVWYFLRNLFHRKSVEDSNRLEEELVGSLDVDVAGERERVHKILSDGKEDKEILLVHDLKKTFNNFVAVDGLNFAVGSGECFGLLGVNGAGKTTTFEMLTGNLVLTEGNAFITAISLRDDRQTYLTNIGYCPQFDALLDHLTGREMLTVFALLRGIPCSGINEIVNAHVEDFDLQEHAHKITRVYSGGNKRKLSAAMAFIGDSPVVFLDEPTTGVDPVARRKIWEILNNATGVGMSVILTSHSMEECEVLCSRVAIMVSGQFRCFGGVQYLKNKFSQGFIILAKLKRTREIEESLAERQGDLQGFVEAKFPSAVLKDLHQGLVHYQVTDTNTKWTYLFETMETAKSRFELEDYSVSQASLEQVFLSFAKKERMEDHSDKKND